MNKFLNKRGLSLIRFNHEPNKYDKASVSESASPSVTTQFGWSSSKNINFDSII